MRGAGALENAGQRVECGARGHNIINQYDTFPANIMLYREGIAQIIQAHFCGQFRLRWGVTGAGAAACIQLVIPALQWPGDFRRLIKSALTQAAFVEWYWYQP
jgi:hypothetical protein